MATRWQQLGGFVGEGFDLSYEQLEDFHRVGGRWIAVLLAQLGYPYDHDPACTRNVAALLHIKEWCQQLGIACGGWFVGWAGGELNQSPAEDAEQVRRMVQGFNLGPVILNCENAYQNYPQELPKLLYETRLRLKTRSIGVSTNSPNDSLIWNGGLLGHKACCHALSIKMLPQWYSSPNYSGPWFHPDLNMAWLKDHGMEDNFYCSVRKNHRAVAQSEVHGTLEVTGLEGSSLAISLAELNAATQYGFTKGFSVYLLESMPHEDFGRLASVAGKLFLV